MENETLRPFQRLLMTLIKVPDQQEQRNDCNKKKFQSFYFRKMDVYII